MLAAWILAGASLGAAQPDQAVIEVEGTVQCLTPAGVEARVTAWAERSELPADARIELVHEPEQLRVRVSAGALAPVERTFSPAPSDCKDAELVAAVAIALALDALAEARVVEAAGTEGAGPEGAASMEEEPAPRAPAEVDRPAQDDEQPLASDRVLPPVESPALAPKDRRPSTSLVLAVGGAARELPVPGFTGAIGMRVAWRALAVTTELELGTRVAAPLGPGPGVVDLVRVAASVGACAAWSRGRWSSGLCALGMGGPLWARARRTADPRAAVVPWLAAGARSEVAVELSPRWWLGLRSDVLFGIVRPSIVATELHTGRRTLVPTPTIGWRAMLAVGFRWGAAGISGHSGGLARGGVKRRGPAPIQVGMQGGMRGGT